MKPGDFDYPRPQLVRANWVSLNGRWRFAFDRDRRHRLPADVTEWRHEIIVPYCPESAASGIHDTDFHSACWYERDFEIERTAPRVILHFGAVDYLARVWINDRLVIEHEGGHTPFSVDITWALQPGRRQRLTVRAEDDPDDLEKPRGKQDWQREPHSIWYPRTTGIWQTVWYECVPETYIERVRWTPHLERWEIGAEFFLAGGVTDDLRVALTLRCGDHVLVDDSYKVIRSEVHRRIAMSDPGIDDYRNEMLWSPERPTLIQAEIDLLRDNTIVDHVESYTAMRSVNIQRDRFLLNGRPYELRLVLDQGYWPDTLMTPPSDEALKRDVELAKAMGFNGVRKHQKLEDPRYLFWADTLGLAVWGEMPSAYRFTNKAIKRSMQEWTQAIRRDYSHPCVIVWVPFNESWGVPDLPTVPAARDAVAAFYHLTKTLDQTRPVIGNDGWESSATDIIGIHDYDCNPVNVRKRYGPTVKTEELFDRRRPGGRLLTLDGFPHRGQPVMLTEFGGIAYVRSDDAHRKHAWGYVRCDDIEVYQSQCVALIDVVRTTGMFSGFCYTQFADTFQEANGLLFDDRTPKLPLEAIAKAVKG
jgi:beta-galactosidase/beta-glucuronidase